MSFLREQRDSRIRIPDDAFICLFGIGVLARECYSQITQMLGRKADYFCDNDASKWSTSLLGVRCISPAELAALALKAEVFVVVASRAFDAILPQLRELGLKHLAVVDYERCYERVRYIREAEYDLSAPIGILPVENRWALVTGAARGVGRLIALEMARRGADLILHARQGAHLDEVAESCSRYGKRVRRIAAEFSDLAEIRTFAHEVTTCAPQIDFVFNNAGISPPCAAGFWEVPAADYLAAFTVNALAPAKICQAVIPSMLRNGFGRIVNLTSSVRGRVNEMAYACSKAALDKFVHDLSGDLEGSGVMISLVDPGWLRTDMGGPQAPHRPDSVLPGVLLGALMRANVNGCWFTAQDYAGLDLDAAARKAGLMLGLSEMEGL
jgi:NAD(P)-dependent dehydrogenase (short-subunit alcohol dehydrogenase family)